MSRRYVRGIVTGKESSHSQLLKGEPDNLKCGFSGQSLAPIVVQEVKPYLQNCFIRFIGSKPGTSNVHLALLEKYGPVLNSVLRGIVDLLLQFRRDLIIIETSSCVDELSDALVPP